MTRIKRIYYKNATYHITIRGNNRQPILQADSDKKQFLETLNKYRSRFKFKLFGFTLMDNHAHLVMQSTISSNISKIMQAITLSYSNKFRSTHNYSGYVWQGRFNSKIIESEKYILECLNYIHNNPVRAGIVDNPRDYTWSSYKAFEEEDRGVGSLIAVDKLTI